MLCRDEEAHISGLHLWPNIMSGDNKGSTRVDNGGHAPCSHKQSVW